MVLGEWVNNLDYYNDLYKKGKPFEHIIINNFFDDDYIQEISNNFPLPTDNDNNWKYYHNPLEHKYSLNNFDNYPKIKEVFDYLQTEDFIQLLRKITDINNLENDPHLHGAGIHAYPNRGKLDIHLDYNIHPITFKERRINLIIYLNKDWDDAYGGNIQLFDENRNKTDITIKPRFNSAIIFKTCDISYHGLPEPIKCPDNYYRKSIAIYYLSEPRENLTKRFKAEYFPQNNQPVNEGLLKLYEIRKNRLITKEDLDNYYPDWEIDDIKNGYW